MNYEMFSSEGNELVDNIVTAAKQLVVDMESSPEEAYMFAERKLEILSNSDGFGEAMDTAVRENVYLEITQQVEV